MLVWDFSCLEKFLKFLIRNPVLVLQCLNPFGNRPLVVVQGEQRAESSPRYYALGQTDASRLLFIVFTIRDDLIRVISARPMSREERRVYEHAKEEVAETDPEV